MFASCLWLGFSAIFLLMESFFLGICIKRITWKFSVLSLPLSVSFFANSSNLKMTCISYSWSVLYLIICACMNSKRERYICTLTYYDVQMIIEKNFKSVLCAYGLFFHMGFYLHYKIEPKPPEKDSKSLLICPFWANLLLLWRSQGISIWFMEGVALVWWV